MTRELDVGVMIAVPTKDRVIRMEWATALYQLAPPMACTRVLNIYPDMPVDQARNTAVERAIKLDADFLFFLDDDVLVPNNTLRRFVQQMQLHPDWDAITAIVPTKHEERDICVFRKGEPGPFWRWDFPETFEIDFCGMAACMIRTSAFEKVEEPWFQWIRDTDGQHVFEEGEDVNFTRKLKAAGGTLMADGAVLCGHIDLDGTIYQVASDAPCFRNESAKAALKETRPLLPA